jgi:hypothetical protein
MTRVVCEWKAIPRRFVQSTNLAVVAFAIAILSAVGPAGGDLLLADLERSSCRKDRPAKGPLDRWPLLIKTEPRGWDPCLLALNRKSEANRFCRADICEALFTLRFSSLRISQGFEVSLEQLCRR